MGVRAIPIITAVSILTRVLIACQDAVQLEKFGANFCIGRMIALSVTRGDAPLITDIVVVAKIASLYTT